MKFLEDFFLKFYTKQVKKLEKLLFQKVSELEQVEDAWRRFKVNDWKSIHFDAVKGTLPFSRKKSNTKNSN